MKSFQKYYDNVDSMEDILVDGYDFVMFCTVIKFLFDSILSVQFGFPMVCQMNIIGFILLVLFGKEFKYQFNVLVVFLHIVNFMFELFFIYTLF